MSNKKLLAFEITLTIFIFFAFFGSVFLFVFSDSVSIKDFLNKIFEQKVIFGKDVFYFYLYIGFKSLAILFGMYFIIYFFICKYFTNIEEYNKKLKDYNHYLAHELKTPIAVINSNLEVLKYGFDEEKIKNSKKELKNITKIIDGLLNFSESFNDIEKKEINLENFIKSFINFKDYKSNVKIINSEFNYSIVTDEVLFERIIKNLIENALKYSPTREVVIFIKNDKIIFENNVYKTLENEELEKIFDKFYSKTCNENSGTGLGLPMIKEISKVLGYKMEVDSKDNKFIVEIDLGDYDE